MIEEHFVSNEAMSEALHAVALDYYRQYMIVGGMPAAVTSFVDTQSFHDVQLIQNGIIQQYIADMSKYATAAIRARGWGIIRAMIPDIAKLKTLRNGSFLMVSGSRMVLPAA